MKYIAYMQNRKKYSRKVNDSVLPAVMYGYGVAIFRLNVLSASRLVVGLKVIIEHKKGLLERSMLFKNMEGHKC